MSDVPPKLGNDTEYVQLKALFDRVIKSRGSEKKSRCLEEVCLAPLDADYPQRSQSVTAKIPKNRRIITRELDYNEIDSYGRSQHFCLEFSPNGTLIDFSAFNSS